MLFSNENIFNSLNAELNTICHLLALLEAHPILHISRGRVKTNEKTITVYAEGYKSFLQIMCETNQQVSQSVF